MDFGFIGLGQMGQHMAANLAKKHTVTVFDKNDEACQALKNQGALVANSLDAFSSIDALILCLPNGDIVQSVLFGDDGMAEHLKPGTIVVDTSTIEYSATLSIAENLATKDLKFIDAPVSGMRARAQDGTLTMMCGGDEVLVEKLLGPLSTMASTILHMGGVGSGQLTKLINQLLFDINAAALAEVLPLAVKLGLDPVQVGEVINSGTGRSYASEFFIPNQLKGDFSKGYPMAAAYKDLISGAEISARQKIPTPVLAAATTTYQLALLSGHGDKDKGGMIRVFEDFLGVTYRGQSVKEQ